jgi:hypothetical protein
MDRKCFLFAVQVHVVKAEPKGSSLSRLILHDRGFRSGNKVYRVGDTIRLTIGPTTVKQTSMLTKLENTVSS